MIIELGLPLKVATIILGCIFLMLFSDFRTCGPISIPTPPITALTEFFYADDKINIHPWLVLWHFISTSLWCYLSSCTHTLLMLWSITDSVSSSSWPILFKVLTLNITTCIVFLHLSSFYFRLSSIADFSNTGARPPTSAQHASF